MNSTDSQTIPAPPNIIKAFRLGFDTIVSHLGLILFAVLFDMLLWLGPHLSLAKLFQAYIDWSMPILESQDSQMFQFIENNRQALLASLDRLNLFAALRSFPVGVPSLMVGRLPLTNPAGNSVIWQIPSFWNVIGLGLALVVLGLIFGTLYFMLTSQAVLDGKINWQRSLSQYPSFLLQTFLLFLLWVLILIGVSLPLMCVTPLLMIGDGGFGSILVFLYAAVLIWLILPLVFSPFGIFIYGDKMWLSVLRGVRLVRYTLPSTAFFLMIIFLVSQGLDWLWSTPEEATWLSLLGVVGHAFVAAGMLAASFSYYRDAGRWLEGKFLQSSRQAA
jgi:hypothetical protein